MGSGPDGTALPKRWIQAQITTAQTERPAPRDLVPDESPAWIRTERTTLGDVSGVLRGDHSEYQGA